MPVGAMKNERRRACSGGGRPARAAGGRRATGSSFDRGLILSLRGKQRSRQAGKVSSFGGFYLYGHVRQDWDFRERPGRCAQRQRRAFRNQTERNILHVAVLAKPLPLCREPQRAARDSSLVTIPKSSKIADPPEI